LRSARLEKAMANAAPLRTCVRSKEEHLRALDAFAQRLGLRAIELSDPRLLREILESDMALADLAPLVGCLGYELDAPRRLGPIIDTVMRSIANDHPRIAESIAIAIDMGLLA
jgi:hypothetical protein